MASRLKRWVASRRFELGGSPPRDATDTAHAQKEVGFAMPREPERAPDRGEWTIERAIVLQVLRDDHDERWPRVELGRELGDFEPAILERALERLEREGVVHLDGSDVRASRAARHLDALDLVGL